MTVTIWKLVHSENREDDWSAMQTCSRHDAKKEIEKLQQLTPYEYYYASRFKPYESFVTPEYFECLVKRNRYLLHQLPYELRAKAIKSVIEAEKLASNKRLEEARKEAKTNLHGCINRGDFIQRLINGNEALRKCRENKNNYCFKYVWSNYCEFDKEGNYIPYPYPDFN